VSRAKPAGTFRILVLGGSTAFDGMVSADSLAWPAQLQRRVQALVPGRRVEVVNGGVPGYVVLDQTISLLTGVSRFEADLVILYDGHNDLFSNLRSALVPASGPASRTPDEIATTTPWAHWLERHSLLYCKLVDRLHAWRFAALGKGRGTATQAADSLRSAATDDGAARFESAVSAFVATAQVYGMKVVLASVATVSPPGATVPDAPLVAAEWRNTVPFASPLVVLRGYARYSDAMQRVAQRQNLPLIRAETFGIWGPQWYAPDDPVHFNDAGSACMGRKMAYALLSAGLLPEPPDRAGTVGRSAGAGRPGAPRSSGVKVTPAGADRPVNDLRAGSDPCSRASAARPDPS